MDRYKLTGIVGAKFSPKGDLIRVASPFTQYLSTEKGVMKFRLDNSPIESIVVFDMKDNVDVTEYFFG